MIELTNQQVQAIAAAGKTPPVVVDPKTCTTYVLLRQDLYERLTDEQHGEQRPVAISSERQRALQQLIGIWKSEQPPSDEQADRIVERERMKKYG